MQSLLTKIIFGGLMLSVINENLAQSRCATPTQNKQRTEHFEKWLENQMQQSKLRYTESIIYKIPVVFHIIHNGEEVGFGENISETRILDQLDRLNEDFRKLNPRASNLPVIFQPVEADIEIEFVLAKQDPNGFPTNGIIRRQGSRSSYNLFINSQVRQIQNESYWDSEKYLNIWVAETEETIGLASWPITTIPGIPNSPTSPEQDGVIVDDDFIGTNFNTDGGFSSFGQTLTHEIGHFLGLRHIWGDAYCGNDFCDDTPEQETHHGNNSDISVITPCNFPNYDSCTDDEFPDMFMNFMDYTNDECMSMFTTDQKSRMRTVLENSPRRASLLTSPALDESIGVLDTDMAFVHVDETPVIICSESTELKLTLANYGINVITNYQISYSVNGRISSIEVDDLLPSGQQTFTNLELTTLSTGLNTVNWDISLVNGSPDDNLLNNTGTVSIFVDQKLGDVPFRMDFEADQWTTSAQIGNSEWSISEMNRNKSYTVNAYNSPSFTESWLISPLMDVSNFSEAGLFFDLSYGIRSTINDQLQLAIQSQCDNEFEFIWTQELSNLPFEISNEPWVPNGNWQTQFIGFDGLDKDEPVRIAFVFTNRGGNNLFIDNIEWTNNSNENQPRHQNGNFTIYPNPAVDYFDVTFGLKQSSNVSIELIDLSGAVLAKKQLSGILNQTVRFETNQYYGVLLVRVKGDAINKVKRFMITQ